MLSLAKNVQVFTGIIWISTILSIECDSRLRKVYEWKQLEFDYSSPQVRQKALDSHEFIPKNAVPTGLIVHYKSNQPTVFISIPRLKPGVPATLGIVTEKLVNSNPVIKPYPSWDWHRHSDQCHPNRILTSYSTMIDECGRLWVLDGGKLSPDKFTCPPQLLAFELKTNKVIHRYEIPSHLYEGKSYFTTLAVDVEDPNNGCQNVFIYMADSSGMGLVVHDVQNMKSWRVTDQSMKPVPGYDKFTVKGESFSLNEGIFGMSLKPLSIVRRLYFHPLSSPSETWVFTRHLRNETIFKNSMAHPNLFKTKNGSRYTQSAGEAVDKDCVLYFGLIGNNSLICWKTEIEYTTENFHVIAHDDEALQFIADVKVINRVKFEELWIISNRFQKAELNTLSSSEVNFRIFMGKTADLAPNKCWE